MGETLCCHVYVVVCSFSQLDSKQVKRQSPLLQD